MRKDILKSLRSASAGAFRAVLVTVLATSGAYAQVSTEEHAAHHPADTAPKAVEPAVPSQPKAIGQHMQEMAALLAQLEQAKNPAEREALVAKHRAAMHATMQALGQMKCEMSGSTANHDAAERSADSGARSGPAQKAPEGGMQGPRMMGPGMMGPGMMGTGMMGTGMMDQGMMQCHQMMQERMDAMVSMMDHMIRHEEARGAAQ